MDRRQEGFRGRRHGSGRYVVHLAGEPGTPEKVGGKGANLSQLLGMEGVRVPAAFCVTTAAFRHVLAQVSEIDGAFVELERMGADDHEGSRIAAARLRQAVEAIGVPDEIAEEIAGALRELGPWPAYAVRSSATAEDLPWASFAGQHDSFLEVVGLPSILEHVSRCWASLFTDRAVAYRARNGIDHRSVEMAVVVQHMVHPTASGVLFTADPVSGHRDVAVVESVAGLGEALVSGTVNPDVHRLREGRVVERAVADPSSVALTDDRVLELVELGRRLDSHFGLPQDVEWCIDGDGVQIVQSRPITTLFPIPEADDDTLRVYVSVGHQQMMMEPMTPLGISVWQLTSRAPMRTAGGRLFVDVTAMLTQPATRKVTLDNLGTSDPLIRDALETVLDRGVLPPGPTADAPVPPGGAPELLDADAAIVKELIEESRASVAALEQAIAGLSGPALFEFIRNDIGVLQGLLSDPKSQKVLLAGFQPRWWLEEHLGDWLDEAKATDVLSLAAPDNVTAEMGLALLDVADVIRPLPDVVSFLRDLEDDDVLEGLSEIEGGARARQAIEAYLTTYGMRCHGEIDLGRPRWSERPSVLVPLILANVDNFGPGESRRHVERGREQADRKQAELLGRLRALPDGDEKARQTKEMIDRLRTFSGYREHPKYGMVSRYFVYRRALLAEAERWVQDGLIDTVHDLAFLTFEELEDAARTRRVDRGLVARRRADFRAFEQLSPPRVLTSKGECLNGSYRRDDVPDGALLGVGVGGGVIEGRARVVLDLAAADLLPGDILVTEHTDPSWSPLFVGIAGLVTEVGGLMTHGAVVAREYGLTAVVSVDHATSRIRDGQLIRVDGTRGIVEVLGDDV